MIRLLFLSDFHFGSCFSPLPKGHYQETAVTEYMTEKYYDSMRGIGHFDACIFNGDMVDGINKFDDGRELYTTDMMEQCELASEMLEYIDADKFHVFDGTGYHTKSNPSGDDVICKIMNGKWHGFQDLLTFEDINIHCRHFQPYSSKKWQRCSSQRSEAYEMEHDGWNVDVYIRSHTHSFDYSGSAQNLTINTPCWKGRDRYIEQKKMSRSDNGYVIITVDGSNYSWEHMVFNVPEKLYTI